VNLLGVLCVTTSFDCNESLPLSPTCVSLSVSSYCMLRCMYCARCGSRSVINVKLRFASNTMPLDPHVARDTAQIHRINRTVTSPYLKRQLLCFSSSVSLRIRHVLISHHSQPDTSDVFNAFFAQSTRHKWRFQCVLRTVNSTQVTFSMRSSHNQLDTSDVFNRFNRFFVHMYVPFKPLSGICWNFLLDDHTKIILYHFRWNPHWPTEISISYGIQLELYQLP
jgi:hypothetical protein